MFHRDNQYLEGRRVRDSRVNRAMANRTSAGRDMISTQWADAEFAALCRLHQAGVAVPYPVQVLGTEILLEFIGEPDGTAAPRLAEVRPQPGELVGLWHQLVTARDLTRQRIDARAPEGAGRPSHAPPGWVLPAPEDLAAVLRDEARHH
jgi:serine/threonine-protein kinase RIO1